MAKQIVSRGGQKILGALASGIGDAVLTKDATTKEVGQIPSIDTSNYLTTSLASGFFLIGNGSGVATPRQLSNALTVSNLGVVDFANNYVTNFHINAAAAISYGKLNLTNSIGNADINASAGILRTKLASGSNNRILINNGSGVFSENSAITSGRVLISDGSGLPTHSTVLSSTLAHLDVSSSVQTQINNRLSFSSAITPAEGDMIYYTGGVWTRIGIGTNGQVLLSDGTIPTWGTALSNGIPTGGTINQYLRKNSSTNYDTSWDDLTISKITGITASAAELNLLAGVTTTTAQLNFLNTASGDIQAQLDAKLGKSLTQNHMFVGDASNVVSALAPGTNGYVLTSVSGVPTWVSPGVGGTVTSVAASGGTTGMSFTGSPITTSGTLTLTGTLAIANGGTNLTALGTANQLLRVNAGATALEYFTPAYVTETATQTLTNKTLALESNTISGTKAQFDTAVTDGNFLYVGDVTSNATHTGEVTGATALTIDRATNFLWSGVHTFGTQTTFNGNIKFSINTFTVGQTAGSIVFSALDSGSSPNDYGTIKTVIEDNTPSSEDGSIVFDVVSGGGFSGTSLKLDGSKNKELQLFGPLKTMSYTTAGLPAAATHAYSIVYDTTVNGLVYSNGTSWNNIGAGGGGGYTNLTEFVAQTAWRGFYSNGSGDVTELAFGASGTFYRSNGASSSPTWGTLTVDDIPVQVFRTEVGTTYTLQSTDRGRIIRFTSNSPITVTLPNGLADGFDCTIVKAGSGNITLSATTTLEGSTVLSGTAPDYAYVVHRASNIWMSTISDIIPDGDKGDITVTSSGSTWTIDADAVDFSKVQNISTARLLGRTSGGSGNIEQLTIGNGLSFIGAEVSLGGTTTSSTTITIGPATTFALRYALNDTGLVLQSTTANLTAKGGTYTSYLNLDGASTSTLQSASSFLVTGVGSYVSPQFAVQNFQEIVLQGQDVLIETLAASGATAFMSSGSASLKPILGVSDTSATFAHRDGTASIRVLNQIVDITNTNVAATPTNGFNLNLSSTDAVLTDYNATKKGLQYAASGYVTNDRSLTDRGYVLGALSGWLSGTLTSNVLVSAPESTNYSISFDFDGPGKTGGFSIDANSVTPIILNGNVVVSGQLAVSSSSLTNSSIRIPHGTAPTSPVDGDVWTTTTSAYVRINGVTQDLLAGGGGSSSLSGLTAATSTNSINNVNFAQTWNWNSLDTNGLVLAANATQGTTNSKLVTITRAGAHSASNVVTYAAQINNNHTGTISTNYGLYVSATGGTDNIALSTFGRSELQIETADTNIPIIPLSIVAITSGTPAIGIGTGMEFRTETGAGSNVETGAVITSEATSITGGSEAFDFVIKTMSGGATAVERFRTKSNGVTVIEGTDIRTNFNAQLGIGISIEKKTTSAAGDFLFIGAAGISGATTGQNLILAAGSGFASGNTNGGHVYLYPGLKNASGLTGNLGIGVNTIADWQGMERGMFVANALTAPTGNPTNGAFFWVDPSTQLPKWRVPGGTVYTLTDTGSGGTKTITVAFGDSSAVSTGVKTRSIVMAPFTGTITKWKAYADQSTTATLRIRVNGTDITGSVQPTLTAARTASGSTLTGWTTSVTENDYVELEVSSNNNALHLAVQLTLTV